MTWAGLEIPFALASSWIGTPYFRDSVSSDSPGPTVMTLPPTADQPPVPRRRDRSARPLCPEAPGAPATTGVGLAAADDRLLVGRGAGEEGFPDPRRVRTAGGAKTREDRNGAGLRQNPPLTGGYSVTHRSTHTGTEKVNDCE